MKTTREQVTRIDSEMPISIHVNGASVLLERFLPHVGPITRALSASENWQTVIESKLLDMQAAPDDKTRLQVATKLAAWAYLGGILNEVWQTTGDLDRTYDDINSPEIEKHHQKASKVLHMALSRAKTDAEVSAAHADYVAASPFIPRPVNQAKLRKLVKQS